MATRIHYALLAITLLLFGCSGRDEPPREPEQLSEDSPFKPLVDSHNKAGVVEAQVLEQAAGTRRAVEAQER